MKRSHPVRTVAAVAAAMLALAACGGSDADPQDAEPVKLTVLVTARTSHAATLIAAEEGYFAEEGLDVELVNYESGSEAVALLVQGELDVWGGTLNAGLVNAFAAGEPIRLVADKGSLQSDACTYYGFLAREETVNAGPLTAESLRGKTISFNRGRTLSRYMTFQMLEQIGLTLDDVEVADLDDAIAMEAMLDGTIDMAVLGEPRIFSATSRGAAVWLGAEDVIPEYPVGVLAFGGKLIEDDRESGIKFMTAYLRGVRQYAEGKTDRNLEVLSAATGSTVEDLRNTCLPPIALDAALDGPGLQGAIDFEFGEGNLDAEVDVADLIDEEFVQEAAKRLAARG